MPFENEKGFRKMHPCGPLIWWLKTAKILCMLQVFWVRSWIWVVEVHWPNSESIFLLPNTLNQNKIDVPRILRHFLNVYEKLFLFFFFSGRNVRAGRPNPQENSILLFLLVCITFACRREFPSLVCLYSIRVWTQSPELVAILSPSARGQKVFFHLHLVLRVF